jgi:hypothetical protein
MTSEPYLFQSDGMLALSGIEFINGGGSPWVRAVHLPAGRWTAIVRVLEPPHDPSGQNDGIPNLLVCINPESHPAPVYRSLVETFVFKAK